MASLTNIIQKLIQERQLPEGASVKNLTDEQWKKVEEAMREAQNKDFESGLSIGMRPGLTPEEQAREDRSNPKLEDPTRAENGFINPSGENKG